MSAWKEIHTITRQEIRVDSEKAEVFDQEKKGLPTLQKEADTGVKPIEPLKFQPVRGTDLFEAEFAVKGENIIFHFWPWRYHEYERASRVPPRFPKGFAEILTSTMSKVFDSNRIEVTEDRDVGAWFVKAIGYGSGTFHRDLSIKAVKALYTAMGGAVSES